MIALPWRERSATFAERKATLISSPVLSSRFTPRSGVPLCSLCRIRRTESSVGRVEREATVARGHHYGRWCSDDRTGRLRLALSGDHRHGFHGELELPERLRPHVNAQYVGRLTSLLAANQRIEEDVYFVDFSFDGETARVQATFVDGDEILVGTGMLRDYRLQIDFPARRLTIESKTGRSTASWPRIVAVSTLRPAWFSRSTARTPNRTFALTCSRRP